MTEPEGTPRTSAGSPRKPPGVSWESWIDRQIRDGMERGDFDDLPGAGKPIPGIDGPHDELWWVRKKLRDEDVDYLPPTLAIRRDRDEALERVAKAASETAVRQIVADLNARITYVNTHTISGPPSTLMPLDVERVVEKWRDERARSR